MPKLTSEDVNRIMKHTLIKSEETSGHDLPETAFKVEGLVNDYAFDRARVTAAKPEIDALLSELPETFQRSKGGGWSFLNACVDKNGHQWGEHRDIEQLICLGIAVGSASWLLKDMTDVLPGGMPYVEVHPT